MAFTQPLGKPVFLPLPMASSIGRVGRFWKGRADFMGKLQVRP
jgi:hypothetical protein